MSNAVVHALEQAAERVGKTLSKDAARAVEKMYRDTGTGLDKVVKNIAEADDKSTRKLLDLAENMGQRAAGRRRLTEPQQRRQLALTNYVHRMIDPERAGDHDYEVVIDRKRNPEMAAHVTDAQNGRIWRGDRMTVGPPKPSVVTIDRAGQKENRRRSLRGFLTRRGKDRDEYPPAMFAEGGSGASVKYVPSKQNQSAGSSMGNLLTGLPDGTRVKITVR